MHQKIAWVVFALTNYLPAVWGITIAATTSDPFALGGTPFRFVSIATPTRALGAVVFSGVALAIATRPIGDASLAELAHSRVARMRATAGLRGLEVGLLTANAALLLSGKFHLDFVRAGWAHHHGEPDISVHVYPIAFLCAPIANLLLLRFVGVPFPGRLVAFRKRQVKAAHPESDW
jgi:hypothetical protein